jgi:hypothetical protein
VKYKITVEVTELDEHGNPNQGEQYWALKKVGTLAEIAPAMKEIGDQIEKTFTNPIPTPIAN